MRKVREEKIVGPGGKYSITIKRKNKREQANETQRQRRALGKIRREYGGIKEKGIKIIKARTPKGYTNMISRIETRLDVIVNRLQMARTIEQARDWIKQGYIKVDGRVIKYTNNYVSKGSKITCTNLEAVEVRIEKARKGEAVPRYLIQTGYLSGIIIAMPNTTNPLTARYAEEYQDFNHITKRM